MSSTEESSAVAAPRRGGRHVWFPIVVIAAAVAWWVRRAAETDYATFYHVLVVLATAASVSIWFARFGPGTTRIRTRVVWGLWLAVFAWLLLFKPVYNGDMGIWSWRLRWAAPADRQLTELAGGTEAVDWRPTPHDYPRFLGTGYWPEVTGVRLNKDWQARAPQEVWRREIGAGWSSFAVVGNYAITQEQRGDQELVSCYRVSDGEVVWAHADDARFDPANFQGSLGGIGPRATPTIDGDRVFTQGGTGIVNCLDARTGRVIWSHDTAAETGADVVVWGKSGSPLVVDDLVIVSVGAPNDGGAGGSPAAAGPAAPLGRGYNSSLVAYDRETGEVRWAAGNRQASYASPVAATFAGERQIIVINDNYVTAHRASDGVVLWERPWPGASDSNASSTQPMPLAGDRVFLSKGYGIGASLLAVTRNDAGEFAAEPLWEPANKTIMKTKFSNPVVRDGYVYGLDDVLLECLEIETGKVQWKKRRNPPFGHGQLLLVGDAILVQTESGELVLVEVSPDEYRELGSVQALDPADPAWNTPAFAPPYLLVRNPREAACYRLAVE